MKVGDYVKILPDRFGNRWYHTNVMKIIRIESFSGRSDLIFTNYTFYDDSCQIDSLNLYQDKECISLSRKQKLNRILNESR